MQIILLVQYITIVSYGASFVQAESLSIPDTWVAEFWANDYLNTLSNPYPRISLLRSPEARESTWL